MSIVGEGEEEAVNEPVAVIDEAPLVAIATNYFAGGSREEIARETGLRSDHVEYHVDRLEAVVFLLAAERSSDFMAHVLGWSTEEVGAYLRQTKRHLGRWRQSLQAQDLVRERKIEGAQEWFAGGLEEEPESSGDDSVAREQSLSVLDFWTSRW